MCIPVHMCTDLYMCAGLSKECLIGTPTTKLCAHVFTNKGVNSLQCICTYPKTLYVHIATQKV